MTPQGAARPRTIVCTDPELDDLNSMIRQLLYSNDMEIAGLIYASSRYHWKGDGRGTEFFLADREYSTPRTSWRWAPGERFIHDAVDAYAEAHPNLLVHDPAYPEPDRLRAVIREGNVTFEGDTASESPGSQLIAETLLDNRDDPVHLQVWAGTSTIARALMSIEQRFQDEPDWPAIRDRVSAKAIITKFDSQDATYDDYIRPVWPGIRVTDVATWTWGYSARHVMPPEDAHLLSEGWMKQNVTGVGPLGRLYRSWGDGRRMVDDDPTDFFHLTGHTAEELTAQGYHVWTEVQKQGEWISEGDTTNMLNLIANGLRGYEDPSYGGWAGRAERTGQAPHEWAIRAATDAGAGDSVAAEYTTTRWFADAQNDFAARLRWSATAHYSDANHHPVLHIVEGVDVTAPPGGSVTLHAEATDPDGDAAAVTWWQYPEAGTFDRLIELDVNEPCRAVVFIPEDAVPGQTIHIIAEAQDDSSRPLKSYQRVIITIEERQ